MKDKTLTCMGAFIVRAAQWAGAQNAADGEGSAALAKKLQNPVASLISVPLQANYDTGIGSDDASRSTLNVQPVIPISLGTDMNLIIRTILPFIDAEAPVPGGENLSQLRLTCAGEPVRISICHCLACQQRTGSVFGTQARFHRDNVAIDGNSTAFRRVGDSGGTATFHFCPTCGSTRLRCA
jgi:hypothetical protein